MRFKFRLEKLERSILVNNYSKNVLSRRNKLREKFKSRRYLKATVVEQNKQEKERNDQR